MFNIWLPVFALAAIADWLAVWHSWRRMGYLTKPAAMLALLVWFGFTGQFNDSLLWFGIGFFFSLLGDIFLLLSHRYFIFGLVAFLLAHLAYIAAFNQQLPQINVAFYVLGLTLVSVWLLIFGGLRSAMKRSSLHAKMVLPVGIYSFAITVMLFSALLTLFRPDWDRTAALLVGGGGLLFFCSDVMLAFDRFVQPFQHARFWVRITYHLGQLGLAAGALLQVLG